jgi:hypothetical protein
VVLALTNAWSSLYVGDREKAEGMLDWKMVGGSWFGNGFRIQRDAQEHWLLEHTGEVTGPVTVEDGPIADLPTLQAAKYKAEELHVERQVSARRQRLGMIGLGGWSLALLSGNPVVFIVAGVIGLASLLEFGMTWFDDRTGRARELVQ